MTIEDIEIPSPRQISVPVYEGPLRMQDILEVLEEEVNRQKRLISQFCRIGWESHAKDAVRKLKATEAAVDIIRREKSNVSDKIDQKG